MPNYEKSCSVGCAKLKVILMLNGANRKAKPGWSKPNRDAVLALCSARNTEVEMERFNGLTPDGEPENFRASEKIYMLDNLYLKSCIAPDERKIVTSAKQQFEDYAEVNRLISEVRKA